MSGRSGSTCRNWARTRVAASSARTDGSVPLAKAAAACVGVQRRPGEGRGNCSGSSRRTGACEVCGAASLPGHCFASPLALPTLSHQSLRFLLTPHRPQRRSLPSLRLLRVRFCRIVRLSPVSRRPNVVALPSSAFAFFVPFFFFFSPSSSFPLRSSSAFVDEEHSPPPARPGQSMPSMIRATASFAGAGDEVSAGVLVAGGVTMGRRRLRLRRARLCLGGVGRISNWFAVRPLSATGAAVRGLGGDLSSPFAARSRD